MKKIIQIRYYGSIEDTNNTNYDIFSNLVPQLNGSISRLGIQTEPDTKFYINDELIQMPSTGLFEIQDDFRIQSFYFDYDDALNKEVIIDCIYEAAADSANAGSPEAAANSAWTAANSAWDAAEKIKEVQVDIENAKDEIDEYIDENVADTVNQAVEKYLSTNLIAIKGVNEGIIISNDENNEVTKNSVAMGTGTSATGERALAIGNGTQATAIDSFSQGYNTQATAEGAHAEGSVTIASGVYSHAEGGPFSEAPESDGASERYPYDYKLILINNEPYTAESTEFLATGSHDITPDLKVGDYIILRYGTDANYYSTARKLVKCRQYVELDGESSLVGFIDFSIDTGFGSDDIIFEGADLQKVTKQTIASGMYAHAEGRGTLAKGTNSHTEGYNTETTKKAYAAHAEGQFTKADNVSAHAEGYNTTASGSNSHAEGHTTEASGARSHAEGSDTLASGYAAHAEGQFTVASGVDAHAEGQLTNATGAHAHAEGYNTLAEGSRSHAEGDGCVASGARSHAEGSGTTASGYAAHAEGSDSFATKDYAHAEGYGTQANGRFSHAEGYKTIATADYQHVQGRNTDTTVNGYNNFVHVVGWGTSNNPKNIHTIDTGGNAWFSGTIKCSGIIINGYKITVDNNGNIVVE